MRTGWLQGTEPRGDEEALGCRGLVGEEAAAALEGVVEEEEEGEDLRGASSVVGEGVEGGEADMFAPSPGKPTWALTEATYGPIRILNILSPWKHGGMMLSQ